MKHIFTFLLAYSFTAIGLAQDTAPFMKFDQESYEVGKITKGDIKEFKYTFINIGEEDISIDLVSGCDCTTLDWPRLPIKPGDTGTIDVIFDSTEKEESETVDIDIYLNNIDPKTGHPILKILDYTFELK